MANTDKPNGFTVVRTDSGQTSAVRYPVAASQTIAAGDMVILSSGLVAIAVSTSGSVLGVAAEAITTTGSPSRANDTIMIYVADAGTVYEGQCSGSSTAALLGATADIEGATGVMEVNENASAEDILVIVGWASDNSPHLDLGANDRAQFKIIRSQYYPVLAAI